MISLSGILWEDTEGYKLDKHVDNDNIFLSLQIYLPSTAQKRTGTIFYADKKVQVPFVPNTGYFCIIPREITHSSGRPVRKGTYRRSLYCICNYCNWTTFYASNWWNYIR